MQILVREMRSEDWPDVRRIYEEGLATGFASLDTEVPDWGEWDENHKDTCRIIAEADSTIAGWAALRPASMRCVYGGVAEVSIYIGDSFRRKGIGTVLFRELVSESEKNDLWTLQALILKQNKGSIKLHRRAGFRKVGVRRKISMLNGEWQDIVLMERRSPLF